MGGGIFAGGGSLASGHFVYHCAFPADGFVRELHLARLVSLLFDFVRARVCGFVLAWVRTCV